MDPSFIIERIDRIVRIVAANPLVYMPMIAAWLIAELYFIIHRDETHGHGSVMSTGLTLVFTSYMISPFAIKDISWCLFHLRTLVVMGLFLYGLFLLVLGMRKQLPVCMAEFFGDPGHPLVPGLMGILYIEEGVPFDWLTFSVIAVPVMVLSVVKDFRRLTYKVSRWFHKE